MKNSFAKHVLPSLKTLALFSVLTGVAYPLFVTFAGNLIFRAKAQGQFVEHGGVTKGSLLIAQEFKNPAYFSARPSGVGYNPLPSGGSNLGPTSAAMKAALEERAKAGAGADLLSASASGLDPHISPGSALQQVERVAAARNLSPAEKQSVQTLIAELTEPPTMGFLGDARVNVLKLNFELDRRTGGAPEPMAPAAPAQ